ncbi:MAG TPA: sulfide/dihydroorotate dehydrogenase-like FAD/NAD-binding protein [bacterium]|nr:sulfide/dihydroorotate dehydrogenase-like FAD/NAD-binding protein [bacterium]HPN35434.1 sulfide/dihydroorotate dehydrogenase-like FAD/NAD-binding protein [bacterium]
MLPELYTILSKTVIAPRVTRFDVYVPEIARKRRAGQFVIIRVWEGGERIPLTIADADPQAGTITLISQSVGKTTRLLAEKQIGEKLQDVVGPLGTATHIEKWGTVVCIGGGIGAAPLHPIAQAVKGAGNYLITILGARTRELIILEKEIRAISDEIIITTDDGSYGDKGLVTESLQKLIDSGRTLDKIITIGPAIMMKMVAETTRPFQIPTLASLNSIMVDGTGMCGGCRVTVAGQVKFVCVDGPEFDAHQVEWSEMMLRLNTFKEYECRLSANGKEGRE